MSQSERAPYFPETVMQTDLTPPLAAPGFFSKIRSGIFFVMMAVITLVMGIVFLPAHLFGERSVRLCIKLWSRIVLFLLWAICGVSYQIVGRENIPKDAALIASNHQSMWETIAFFDVLENPVLAFKKELLSLPIYRWWGVGGGGIVIDRAAGARAIKALNADATAKIEEGAQVVIFPEGTRAPAGTINRLKPGIAGLYIASGAPCTPCLLYTSPSPRDS